MERPNIVLIMCDQQRREHLGCYGSAYGVTPNLDRLAGEGIAFDRAYTTYPVCTPARAAIFTGRTPLQSGAYTNELPLYETVPTLGEIFGQAGYRVGYIGKWHLDGAGYLGGGKAARGFPDALWYDGEAYRADVGEAAFARGYGSYTSLELREADLPDALCWATRNTDRAVAFIEQHAESDEPFLLVVSHDEPHPPAVCPARLLDRVKLVDIELPATMRDPLEGKPLMQRRWQAADREKYDITPASMRDGIHRYLACNAFVDEQIGRLLDCIDRECRDNTAVIYTVDHGDFCGDFGLTGKGPAMYDAITRVPLLVRAPGVTRPGIRTTALTSTLDLMPTMLELAGITANTPLDGVSQCSTLADPESAARDAVYLGFDRYQLQGDAYGGFFPIRAICSDGWKLVINACDLDELYNLTKDPAERINRINDPAAAEIRDAMHDRLLASLDQARDPLRGELFAHRSWRPCPPSRFTIA